MDEFFEVKSLLNVCRWIDGSIVIIGGLYLCPGISNDGHVLCVGREVRADRLVVEDDVVTQDVEVKGWRFGVRSEFSEAWFALR